MKLVISRRSGPPITNQTTMVKENYKGCRDLSIMILKATGTNQFFMKLTLLSWNVRGLNERGRVLE
jgi:hypothetical protein